MALDNLRGGTKRVVEENTPLNNLRGGTKRVVIVDGGGGSVDYAKTVQRAETMPTADASNAGQQFLYSGESDATYTHGYIYENVATTTSSSASAEQTVGSTLSDIAVDLDTLEAFTGWTTDNSLQIFYTADGWSVDTTSLGVTYTGTPNVGDAITITYTAESTSYAWTQIDVQPAGSSLPDQTGQSGKFLTTDGTDASWSDKPLVNNATGSGSIVLGTTNNTGTVNSVVIGSGSSAATFADYVVAIGRNAQASTSSVAMGNSAKATSPYAIQIGDGTNSDTKTFKVANGNGNFEIMSADGTVPHGRLTNAVVSNAVTIAVADWNGGTTCTKTISGLTATSVVWVAPDNASQSDYLTAGVYASAQTTDTLEFSCGTTPTSAITVNVVYC